MILDFCKFKILCINVFLILHKAATLSPYKLQNELKEIDNIFQSHCNLCHKVLVIFISLYLEIKFVVGYITLGANVIAVFPILTDDLPHLLFPALLAQSIDHILLNLIEIILGLFITKIVAAKNMSVFLILLLSKLLYIIFAVTALNIYSDYYQQLKFIPLKLKLTNSIISGDKFIQSHSY